MALRPIVLSGPSGSGKSTLLSMLFKEFPSSFGFSVSHTTRQPRQGEVNGKHYHFTTVDQMRQEINEGKFIEHAMFSGNYYGTSFKAVQDVLDKKIICLLDIDEQGVKSIKETELNPLYIFVAPPSLKSLRLRLQGRGTESEETIEKRMATAVSAMEFSEQPGVYDIIIVNNDLEVAYQQLKLFLEKEYPHISQPSVKAETESSSNLDVAETQVNDSKETSDTSTENSNHNTNSSPNTPPANTDQNSLAVPVTKAQVTNGSITDISLSPVKLKVSPQDDIPAIMPVDSSIDMNSAAVVTNENVGKKVVITTQSSVIDMEPEATKESAVCGDATRGWCNVL